MAKNVLGSSTSYVGDASTSLFSISFALGTINVNQIKVYLDDVLKTNITDYTIINNDSQVQFTTAPALGVTIDIRREQDDNSLEVDYQDTKQVKEKNLDNSNKALYYLIHEVFDGWFGKRFKLRKNLDANNKRIINLGDAEDPKDAINLQQVSTLISGIQAPSLNNSTYVLINGTHATYSADNLTYDFTSVLTTDVSAANIYIQGVKQISGLAFTIPATSKTIVFTEALGNADLVELYIEEV